MNKESFTKKIKKVFQIVLTALSIVAMMNVLIE